MVKKTAPSKETAVAVVTKLPPKKTAPNNAEKKKKTNKKAPPKKKGPPKKNAPPKTDQYEQYVADIACVHSQYLRGTQSVLARLDTLEKLNKEKDNTIVQLQRLAIQTAHSVERLTDIVWLGFQSLAGEDWEGFPQEVHTFTHLPVKQSLMEPAFGHLSSPPYE